MCVCSVMQPITYLGHVGPHRARSLGKYRRMLENQFVRN